MRLFLIFLLILFSIVLIPADLTGETVSGESILKKIQLEIKVSEAIPIINIISPKNGTYLSKNINLIYETINVETVKTSIDGNKNLTFIGPADINLNEGNHTIKIYAINNNSIIIKSINFTINLSKFEINYKTFGKDNTTDFYAYPFEEYTSFNNITLQTNNGKIFFNTSINLIEDKNPEDQSLDLDKNIKITHNQIKIDLLELPNFDTAAHLELYKVNLKNPIIMKDDEICPKKECEMISYEENTVKFYVKKAGTYRLQEADSKKIPSKPETEKTPNKKITKKFELNENQVLITTNQGKIIEKEITIKNNLDKKISVNIEQTGLNEILNIIEKEIILEPLETKKITLEFLIRETSPFGIHLAEVRISSEDQTEEIWIVLEIESENALFDVSLELTEETKQFKKGEDITILTKLYNLGETKRIDAINTFTIKNKKGIIVYQKSETVAVETHLDDIKNIPLPDNLPPGEYILTVKTEYEGKIALATETFEVKAKSLDIQLILMIIIIILIILVTYLIYKLKFHKSKTSKSLGK